MAKFDLSLLPPSPDLTYEEHLWQAGLECIAGLDEAGRGAWAGPVYAAAVWLPSEPGVVGRLSGVRDSKQMTPAQRSEWATVIKGVALGWGVGFANSQEIDELGILPATRLAMSRAVAGLVRQPQHLLVDYLALPGIPIPQTPLVKGDSRSLSIAAASVLAKTSRDAVMVELGEIYPEYGFAQHKGYGTRQHAEMLQRLGPCQVHRFSFMPIREPQNSPEIHEEEQNNEA